MRRLLVTGGAGFIGANFVKFWLENYEHDQVVAEPSKALYSAMGMTN